MYLEIKDVKKSYGSDASYIQVLKGITTSLEKGQMCVIQGTSGSGKSTLLNCIGGLDTMDSGSVKVDGKEIFGLKPDKLADYRKENLGFIFQFYNLVPNLTVVENIQVCEYLSDSPLDMEELLTTLGLSEHRNKFPSQLSGGQQQRCAIARALIKNPKLLLCDEPTGALDSKTSRDILILLEKINAKYGTTMLIVTHNNAIKNMVHKVIIVKDGLIKKDYLNETRRAGGLVMNRVLRKRLGRELKTNFARYLALVLLIVMGMYIIVSVVASADTIIDGTAEHGKQNKVEDGQFGVFIPLTDEQEKEITDKGITLEQHFSIDVTAKDCSKLRVFRKRNDIDLIELDSGRFAEKKGEAVVEKRYSEEHSLSVGDKLTAGGVEFEIVGIGTTPDYDTPFENFSDTAVSSKGFGLLFVSDDQYDYFKNDSDQKA